MTPARRLAYNSPLFRRSQRCSPRRTRTRSRSGRIIDPFTRREIRRLVAEFGSPLLIIDCQRVREQYRKLHKALPGVDLHYALKPLPHPAVVETIVELGGWLDLATTGETQLVTQLGIDPARCIHTHPIKRDIDIRNALHLGVKIFVADNPGRGAQVRGLSRPGRAAAARLVPQSRAPWSTCRANSAAIPRTSSSWRGSRASSASRCAACRSTSARRRRIPANTSRPSRCAPNSWRRRGARNSESSTRSTSAAVIRSNTARRSPTSAGSARPSARRWPNYRRACG